MKTIPTIVTGFFDLNRGQWNNSNRSTEKYISAFEFWAGIQNNLVVYTNSEMAQKVKKIREKRGLIDKTTIIEINDYKCLDRELYCSIKKAMIQTSSLNFHLKPNHPESWNIDYNYVMMLKWWCVCDAINKNIVGESVAWIDFGFNNCGTYYTKSNEFNFVWECDLEDKINLFCINEPDETPIFEIVQKMETYVQGCSIVGPSSKWLEFSKLVRESVLSMNEIGFADDDQIYMLMAYRKKPELFKINLCPWFSIFQVTTNKSFSKNKNLSENKGMKYKVKQVIKNIEYYSLVCKYLKKQKRIMLNKNTIND